MEKKPGKLNLPVKIALGVALFFLLYTLLGFFVAPAVLKSVLTGRLTEALHREVSIREIRMNPYALTLRVTGFSIKDRQGPGKFVSFDELYVNLQAVSLFKRALVLCEFQLTGPSFHLVRTGETTFNFSDLMQGETTPAKTPAEPSKPFRFSVSNIIISNGGMELRDEVKGKQHRIEGIRITLPFVSNFPYHTETYLEPGFQAAVNGTPVAFSGKTRPFLDTHETTLDIDVQALDLTRYLPYLPLDLPYRIESGFVDLKTQIAYVKSRERDTLSVSGRVTLRDFKAFEPTGEPLNELPRVEVDIDRSDVLSNRLHIRKLFIQSPRVRAVRNASGELNLTKLLAVKTGEEVVKQGEEEKAGFILDVDEIVLSEGRVDFRDEGVNEPFAGHLEKVNLSVSGFSNGKDKRATFSVSLATDAGEEVKTEGSVSVNPLALDGKLGVSRVPIRRYEPYYKDTIAFSIEEGSLDVRAAYGVTVKDPGGEPQVRISEVSTVLSGLKLKRPKEKGYFFEAADISLSDASVDLPARQVVIGGFSTKNGKLSVSRSPKGEISLQDLLPPPASAAPTRAQKGETKAPDVPAQTAGDWTVLLKRGEIAAYSVAFEDLKTKPTVKLLTDGISLVMEDISNARNSKGRLALAMRLPRQGRVSAQGALSINPLTADLKLDVGNIDIRQFEPYWKDMIHLAVTGGAVSTSGSVQFAQGADEQVKGKFRGEVRVSGFATVDRSHSEDFLKWKSLRVTGIDASYNPTSVAIAKVALSDFYSRIRIDENARTNIQDILVSSEPAEKAPAPKSATARPGDKGAPKTGSPPVKINVKTIALEGGKIYYTDRLIRPNVEADLTDLAGQVTGLTSDDAKYADVDLKGKVGRTAPLEIKGKINPLGKDLFLDLEIRTKGIELTPATPYAGKYIGYTIAKGKLSLDLKYYIADKKLAAENKVFLDQLTLGDTVESPDATKLPVALAISLLKNRDGEIKLDLPVSGTLDDPQFKVGKVILQMIVNLLQKVLTAPFSLLGALVGGGEELSYLEFSPGSDELGPPGRDKLTKLTEVLYDRPNLKIELEGHADPQADMAALREKAFLQKLKSLKIKAMGSEGTAGASPDQITLEPEEYDRFLKLWYLAERAKEAKDKPRPVSEGKDKPAPEKEATPEEMKQELMGRIQVSNDEIRLLAQRRAQAVGDFVLASGKVEAQRVFLVEPKAVAPEKKENVKESRVDFRLR